MAGPGFEGFKAGLVDLFHQALALLKCGGHGNFNLNPTTLDSLDPDLCGSDFVDVWWIFLFSAQFLSKPSMRKMVQDFFRLLSTYPENIFIGCLCNAPDSKLSF